MIHKRMLSEFRFQTANDTNADFISRGVTEGDAVSIPHTWNVRQGLEDFIGTGWYSTEFELSRQSFRTVLFFHAVYRDCRLFLNGKKIGVHMGSGYTPFEIDITDHTVQGKNLLVIQCTNAYSKNALPYKKEFDWACDGGIIRNIELIEYSANYARACRIESTVTAFLGNGKCSASVRCEIELAEKKDTALRLRVTERGSGKEVLNEPFFWNGAPLRFHLENARLWSAERPNLYILEVEMDDNIQTYRFGLRKIETRGDKIYLNDHEIKLLAVEWMPGSNPCFGMAEPKEELRKNLEMLKDLNCNFTRFHWQQDDFVLDWCDENGLMVQEEIPYWGAPKAVGKTQRSAAFSQADEMLQYHYNHPAIVCWGAGNELGGWKNKTVSYVKDMAAYFKARDPMRLVTYVSNTMGWKKHCFFGKRTEATAKGDICMWNDYMGTWYPVLDYKGMMKYVLSNTRGKPLVITEFGLCEPAFKGGDQRRIQIYEEKLELYKKFNLAGWVYFSLNDYRTHVGESGTGRFKQRIHGSVDLNGNKKPSYDFIKRKNAECAALFEQETTGLHQGENRKI